ncbi:MAG: phosphomannomutase/phosphoglucomutase [Xanthomonadales bacterium]|nr:phosphomannomutase/phosphoglucomutase [Xanthomonadales bacterium]
MATNAANSKTAPRQVTIRLPNPQALLSTVLGVLLLLLGLIYLRQGWDAWRADSLRSELAGQAEALAGIISERISSHQASLDRVVTERDFLETFASEGMGTHAGSKQRLMALLPEALSAEVLDAPVLESVGADLADFGYARVEMLLQSERSQKGADAQIHRAPDGDDLRVVLVSPILVAGTVAGHAMVELPYGPLRTALNDWRGSSGTLDLVQGTEIQDALVIDKLGSERSAFDGSIVTVPRTRLAIAYSVPPPFALIAPSSAIPASVLGVIGLLIGVTLVALRAQLKKVLNRAREATPDEPTLADSLGAAGSVAGGSPGKDVTKAAVSLPGEDQDRPPPPPGKGAKKTGGAGSVERSMFRAYDIRGIVDESLTESAAELIGQAIGSEIRDRGMGEVVVARDGRLSGPDLIAGLIEGLRSTGCDVIDIGAVPTPVLYFATHELNTGCGVMVTGSHNPPNYNGFKIMIGGETVAEERIQGLYARIAESRFVKDVPGGVQQIDIVDRYIERIAGDLQVEFPLKIVIDAGNGIAGAIAPRLFEEIGCEVTPLYCDVDGNFPNHHPDPSDPKNMRDLGMAVKQLEADLGIAFDGDGDRLGVITPQGEIVFADRLLMLFASDVLTRNPGATIIYDVKCTGRLAPIILTHGGSPVMWKTGHSLIKARMRELDAALAGEMSGHFFFKERWYGFDDGLYAGCRLLEILASSGQEADELFSTLPKGVSTPELKVETAEGEHYRFISRFVEKARLDGARITTIDGLRADWEDGWGLVRASNTTPSLVLRFDADDEPSLRRVQEAFREQILAIDPGMNLPF